MTFAPPQKSAPVKLAGVSPLAEALRLCRSHFNYALLFSALVNLAYLAPTLYMLQVYDRVVPSASELTLGFLTLALVLTLLMLTSLDQLRQRILSAASVRLDRVFSARLFRRALSTPGGQAKVNQQVRDFDTIRATATGPAMLAAFDAPWVPIYVAVCFVIHPVIGALALGGAVVLIVLAIWNERHTRDHFARASTANALAYASQESAGAGGETVRALGMTEAFVNQFETARMRAHVPQIEAAQANGKIGGLIRFLRLFLQSVALGVGAWLAINKQISPGAIFASSMLASRALSPIDQVVAQWRSFQTAFTAYHNLKVELRKEDSVEPTRLPDPAPKLSVDRLTIATPTRDRFLLRDVTFGAQGGAVLGVLGASGAGKTTLLQALANARPSDQGEVRLDGARYADWDDQRLARHIGYVPQDNTLFPGTIKDNISRFDAYAGVDAAEVDEKAIAAAKLAGVHDMILGLSGGYDFPLGARGRGLSAGQQQRIALARAVEGDPVLYVLDEPNSALDAEGEVLLMKCLGELRARGALVIVATHRTSLVAAADLLAILKDGRIERFGPRQEVLESLRPAAAPPAPVPAPPAPANVGR